MTALAFSSARITAAESELVTVHLTGASAFEQPSSLPSGDAASSPGKAAKRLASPRAA